MNGAPPIPFSRTDLERQRLESTLDHDLSTLSLGASNPSTSFASHSSVSTLGVPRSAAVHDYRPTLTFDETPRRPARHPSCAASFASAGVGASPTSTDGHHVSAATLGAGVFNIPNRREAPAGEFDPDRSLGRLVGQLTRAMEEERIINKPASPFRPASPRSPTPQNQLPNLSFSLGRNDPLPSPPQSRTVSATSSKSSGSGSGPNALAELQTQTYHHDESIRRPLVDTRRHNQPQAPPERQYKKGSYKAPYLVPVVQPSPGRRDRTYDLTGITGLLATPMKGPGFEEIDKNAAPATMGAGVPSALASLQAHVRALQNENGVANHRIAELEVECARAREEVAEMQAGADTRLAEVVGEKAALEELVASLRTHLVRLTAELDAQKAAIAELRRMRDTDVRSDLATIKEDIERLSREVARLNEIAEQGLIARTNARSQRSMHVEALDLAEEVARVSAEVGARESRAVQTHLPSQLRQGIHAAGAPNITLLPASAKAARVANESDEESDVTHSPTPSRRPGSRASQVDDLRPASRQSHAESLRHVSRQSVDARPVLRQSVLSPHLDAFRPARQVIPEEQDTMIYVPAHEGPSPAAQRAEHELQRKEHSRREYNARDVAPNLSGSSTRSRRNEGPASPFPSIRAEDELSFFSERPSPHDSPRIMPRRADKSRADLSAADPARMPFGTSVAGSRVPSGGSVAPTVRMTSGDRDRVRPSSRVPSGASARSLPGIRPTASSSAHTVGAATVRSILEGADVPPATVLARVIAELEADFAHYKSIYVELADQYKVLDAASAVAKRHVLAAHLKEVIDCLEHKADQVAALYSLMSVHDRPASPAIVPRAVRSVHELWAGVRDVLGEDAVRRLEADGLFRH
ncbi:hypothetical protein CcaverHIS002_0500600 [Cutaneotrichosporon cavernicola]|uniref:Cep57 centrosome microtubule-binding domain-containing protein n=1 Tax=Cutaneotrichosporon cavernicola TaxID=279322 RepID=A0AA48QXP4_9TREE|nr:uncharacterized protein CcaverHIS019_0600600 [Cutaneotrichosporon cavernicola]BEI84659.1 hypothetical protein CcaverHIS002_0500600 [Cutaneotrichosporon cavernicola]BEI93601.1 hypothetical protein CcaverHIS019_0600600 [Cutaneotrichosporon cavernicola]BEJ01378.1 hypothetical protein CcaverHIS631_0600600 [Cutaneotrichosporon cavernicola]BEJ09145.1 hypothetical protein CcaverHIS641_0600600 [Cutaneotrichosporon cavernicola]